VLLTSNDQGRGKPIKSHILQLSHRSMEEKASAFTVDPRTLRERLCEPETALSQHQPFGKQLQKDRTREALWKSQITLYFQGQLFL